MLDRFVGVWRPAATNTIKTEPKLTLFLWKTRLEINTELLCFGRRRKKEISFWLFLDFFVVVAMIMTENDEANVMVTLETYHFVSDFCLLFHQHCSILYLLPKENLGSSLVFQKKTGSLMSFGGNPQESCETVPSFTYKIWYCSINNKSIKTTLQAPWKSETEGGLIVLNWKSRKLFSTKSKCVFDNLNGIW